jgi:predicted RNase H-like HicB family nuclease
VKSRKDESQDAIKLVEVDGWRLARTRGSHRQYQTGHCRSVYTEAGNAEMSTYTVFIEPTATGYSAYVPDLPGCIGAASTLEETRQLMKEAIEFHIEGMRMHGEDVPEPTPHVEQIEVSA